jgi:hypothetical protein
MDLDIVDVYQYHSPQKNSLRNSNHNFSFEIYLYFLTFILIQNTSYVQIRKCLVEFLFK